MICFCNIQKLDWFLFARRRTIRRAVVPRRRCVHRRCCRSCFWRSSVRCLGRSRRPPSSVTVVPSTSSSRVVGGASTSSTSLVLSPPPPTRRYGNRRLLSSAIVVAVCTDSGFRPPTAVTFCQRGRKRIDWNSRCRPTDDRDDTLFGYFPTAYYYYFVAWFVGPVVRRLIRSAENLYRKLIFRPPVILPSDERLLRMLFPSKARRSTSCSSVCSVVSHTVVFGFGIMFHYAVRRLRVSSSVEDSNLLIAWLATCRSSSRWRPSHVTADRLGRLSIY